MKYCDKCGKKLEYRFKGEYNVETGDKIMEPYCPSEICDHIGWIHPFVHIYKYDKPIKPYFLNQFFKTKKCIKCGQREGSGYSYY
jgi:hypothetical protein